MGVWSLPLEACDRSVINVSLDSYPHVLLVPKCCQGTGSNAGSHKSNAGPKQDERSYGQFLGAYLCSKYQNERAPLRTAVVNS